MIRSFLANIELWLSGAGLLVILALPPLLIGPSSTHLWQAMAVVAVAVGVLHGLIFWVLRRRRRAVRNEALAEIREMLRDQVNNQLHVIMLSTGNEASEEMVREVEESVARISDHLEQIGEESLQRWSRRYGATQA